MAWSAQNNAIPRRIKSSRRAGAVTTTTIKGTVDMEPPTNTGFYLAVPGGRPNYHAYHAVNRRTFTDRTDWRPSMPHYPPPGVSTTPATRFTGAQRQQSPAPRRR